MKPPLVSVIVPAFNAQAYIGQTLESAVRQTLREIEIIVVDDGSHDQTPAIVDSFAARDERVRVLHQASQGVAVARNSAIAAAQGDFIAPLDADDVWDPSKLERQVQHMEEGGPSTGLVYCWWVWTDRNGHVLDASPRWRLQGDVLRMLAEVNFTGNASVPLYRRKCLEDIGGYDPLLRERGAPGCEDWDVAIRVAERHAVAAVPAYLVGYRRRADSMSAACGKMWKSHTLIMQQLRERRPDVPREVFRRSRGQFAMHLAGVSFWSKAYPAALGWIIRARRLGLALAVTPYLLCALARNLTGDGNRISEVGPNWESFEQGAIPEPMIPYDRICARRWNRDALRRPPRRSERPLPR